MRGSIQLECIYSIFVICTTGMLGSRYGWVPDETTFQEVRVTRDTSQIISRGSGTRLGARFTIAKRGCLPQAVNDDRFRWLQQAEVNQTTFQNYAFVMLLFVIYGVMGRKCAVLSN